MDSLKLELEKSLATNQARIPAKGNRPTPCPLGTSGWGVDFPRLSEAGAVATPSSVPSSSRVNQRVCTEDGSSQAPFTIVGGNQKGRASTKSQMAQKVARKSVV